MAKIVKLTPAQQREWRQNVPKLVSADGTVLRDATREEVAANFRAKQNKRQLVLEVDGIKYRIVPGREVFARKMLELHGECQLRNLTGQFLKMLRDPNAQRPKAKDAQRLAPHPDSCVCRSWGEPHPGKHHPICEYNKYAKPEERSDIPVTPRRQIERRPIAETRPTTVVEAGSKARVEAAPPQVLPAPADCFCKAWQKPDGADPNQHHPICEFHDLWLEQEAGRLRKYVYDLDTGIRMRPAARDEVEAAARAVDETGSPIIQIGTGLYAVGDEDWAPGDTVGVEVQSVEPMPEVTTAEVGSKLPTDDADEARQPTGT